METRRIAVIGHVEHVTLGRASAVPKPGDILHLHDARVLAGGGGAIAFAQIARSDAEVHFFTALGQGEAREQIDARLGRGGARVHLHAAERRVPHPRVVVVVDPDGQRTIVVTGEPLQPAATDPLPWAELATFDAVYFTGAYPETLVLARRARRLVVTARRRAALDRARIAADVIVGSVSDPRESAPRAAYDPPPGALVLTDGPRPIRVEDATGSTWVDAPPSPARVVGDYGAGDSFAGALTFFLAHDVGVAEACARAGLHGRAVLDGVDPIETQTPLPNTAR